MGRRQVVEPCAAVHQTHENWQNFDIYVTTYSTAHFSKLPASQLLRKPWLRFSGLPSPA